MSILTTISDLQRFASACVRYANETSSYNFRVEFHDGGHRFSRAESDEPKYYTYRNGNSVTIHVPNPSTAMSDRDAKVIKAGILHEIIHTVEGTHDGQELITESGINKLDHRDPLSMIFNTVEDHRIERLDSRKFDGDAVVLRDGYEILSEEFAAQVRSGEIDIGEINEDTQKLWGLRLADLVARQPWMNLGATVDDQINVSPDSSVKIADALIEKGYDTRLQQVETVDDTIRLSKEIFEELFEENADEHIEQNQVEGEAQEGTGKDGEGQDGKRGEGGDGDDGGDPDRRISERESDYLEILRRRKRIPNSGDAPPTAGLHIDYTEYLKSAGETPEFSPCPLDQIGVANFGTNHYKNTGDGTDVRALVKHEDEFGSESINRVFSAHSVQVNSLANQIKRLLQVHSQARWVGGATSGRVHRKSAYRAAVPTIGDGRWNREIFKRRYKDDILDVSVSILCDFSGSMGGEKMAHATFGGFILADSIGRVLRIPTQVTTFSEYDEYTIMCVLKNWNENVNAETYKSRAARAANTMQENDDGSAIVWAYTDIKRRPEKRKVLIVLSDGSPASSRPGDAMRYTKNIVKGIEQEGIVEMYGIGIQDRNVELIYKDRSTIRSPDEIEGAILQTVKRKLIV